MKRRSLMADAFSQHASFTVCLALQKLRNGCVALMVLGLSLSATSLFAADWKGSTGNWNDATGWGGGAWVSDSTAVFGGTAGTLNLGTAISASGLVFNVSGYVLTNSSLTIGAGGVSGDGNARIASDITGAGDLNKLGTGTLALHGNKTYTGSTRVQAGTVVVTNATAFASTNIVIDQGATVEFVATTAWAYYGPTATKNRINGQGTFRKTGANIVSISGTGYGTIFSLGTNALIDIQKGTIKNGIQANADWTENKADLNIEASGQLDTWNGGSIFVDAITGSGKINTGISLNGPPAFNIGVTNGTGVFSGQIGDSFSEQFGTFDSIPFNKKGTGTQTFSGKIYLSSLLTIDAGTMAIGGTNYSTGANTVNSGGTLRADSATALGIGGYMASGTAVNGTTVNTGGLLDLNGQPVCEAITIASSAAITNSSATRAVLSNGLAGVSFSNGGSDYSPQTTVVIQGGGGSGAAAQVFFGITTNSVTLTSSGTGYKVNDTFELQGGGGSLFTLGSIKVSTTNSAGGITGIALNVAGGGYTNNPTAVVYKGTTGTSATFTINPDRFQVVGLILTNSGSGYASAPTITLSSGNGTFVGSATLPKLAVTAAATLTMDDTLTTPDTFLEIPNVQAGSSLTGPLSIIKNGTDTNILLGTHAYTGPTTINDGTLQVGMGGAIGNVGTGAITNKACLLFNIGAWTTTVSAAISGTGSVIKTGSGQVTVSTGPTYTGPTVVSGGTLKISGGTFPSSRVTLSNNATFWMDATAGITYASPVSDKRRIEGFGTFLKSGVGEFIVSENNVGCVIALEPGSLINIQNGSIKNGGWQNADWTQNKARLNIDTSGALNIWNGAPIYVDSLTGTGSIVNGIGAGTTFYMGVTNGSGTYSGTITALGMVLRKRGTGTQIFSGDSSWSGGSVTVENGLLALGDNGNTGSITTPALITLQASGTLGLNHGGSGNVWTNSNTFTGAGKVQQMGSGMTVLTNNANSYSGGTVLSAGVLSIDATNQIGSGAVTFAGGRLQWRGGTSATLKVDASFTGGGVEVTDPSATVTFDKAVSGTGIFTKLGAGTVTLTGINTIGALDLAGGTVSGGTLAITDTLSPGGTNNIAPLNLGSNLKFSGTYYTDVALNGNADVVAVTGNIELNSPTLWVVNTNLLKRVGSTTIMTCTGTVSGSFTAPNLPAPWEVKAIGNKVKICGIPDGTMIRFF
jgi:autotransporter-associated beta strand protein